MVINEYLCEPDTYPKDNNEQPVVFKNMDILAVTNKQQACGQVMPGYGFMRDK